MKVAEQLGIIKPENLVNALNLLWYDLKSVINGNLWFGNPSEGPNNLLGAWYEDTTPGANVEFEIVHNLGYVPTGYLVFYQDVAGSFYNGGTPWTTTSIFLKCSTAAVTARIFVT